MHLRPLGHLSIAPKDNYGAPSIVELVTSGEYFLVDGLDYGPDWDFLCVGRVLQAQG